MYILLLIGRCADLIVDIGCEFAMLTVNNTSGWLGSWTVKLQWQLMAIQMKTWATEVSLGSLELDMNNW